MSHPNFNWQPTAGFTLAAALVLRCLIRQYFHSEPTLLRIKRRGMKAVIRAGAESTIENTLKLETAPTTMSVVVVPSQSPTSPTTPFDPSAVSLPIGIGSGPLSPSKSGFTDGTVSTFTTSTTSTVTTSVSVMSPTKSDKDKDIVGSPNKLGMGSPNKQINSPNKMGSPNKLGLPNSGVVLNKSPIKLRSTDKDKLPPLVPIEGFRVLQWNALADMFATTEEKGFPHTDPKVLEWAFRQPLILEELRQFQADVICMEEIDHFAEISRALADLGYQGEHHVGRETNQQGICYFYNTTKFHLVKSSRVNFSGTGVGQCGLLVHLKGSGTGAATRAGPPPVHVFVAVTHLKAKEGFDDVRREQGHELLKALYQFVMDAALHAQPHVVVCGDFNDIQGSPVYAYFQSNPYFRLNSAYASYDRSGQEPFTTLKQRDQLVCRTIDYVWHSPSLGPQALADAPVKEDFPEYLPCESYPSDHIAQAVDFKFRL